MGDADLLSALVAACKTTDIDKILGRLPVVDSEDYFFDPDGNPTTKWRPGYLHWVPVGRDRGNSGRIKLAGEPTGPIAERTINGMEAIIELARLREKMQNALATVPASPRDAVHRYFGLVPLDLIPRMDQDEVKAMQQHINAVRKRLAVHLTYKNKEFAFLVRDEGMGQTADRMSSTLLSLGHTDKADKPYLIGVFGQGGSSAFAVSQYSVVISRRAKDLLSKDEPDRAGWSIVREIKPKGTRDSYYAYLAASEDTRVVPSIDGKVADKLGFRPGSHFCHIKYDLGRTGQAVARRLYQMLNHHLFNPILPYDLYALKDKPDLMQGTAQRLSRRVVFANSTQALDRSFAPQAVA